MKGNFTIEHYSLYFKMTAFGAITFNDSIMVMEEATRHPEFKTSSPVIVDLSDMNFHPAHHELQGIRDHLIGLKSMFKGKMAVISSKKHYAIVELVCTFAFMAGMKIKVFLDEVAAVKWVTNTD